MTTVRRKLHFVRAPDRSVAIADAPRATDLVPAGRVPRLTRLMALAIHFERLLRDREVADMSELARLSHVSQPRITQLMNLNHLAPDIQESLLDLDRVTHGREPLTERDLRPVAAMVCWRAQRRMWRTLQSARLR